MIFLLPLLPVAAIALFFARGLLRDVPAPTKARKP